MYLFVYYLFELYKYVIDFVCLKLIMMFKNEKLN